MSPRKSGTTHGDISQIKQPVSLKALAEYLGLSPATVSLVMNRAPGAKAISEATKARILAAARKFNYRANFVARSLRTLHSFTIGVLVPEISEGYSALVMSGIEDRLLESGYFYFVASHRHRPDLLEEYPQMFMDRAVEGLIAVDTRITHRLSVPVVAVSGHQDAPGITNIVLNHRRGANLVLDHLYKLGHRRIAFIKGQKFSSDTTVRWNALREGCSLLGLGTDLVVQLEGDSPSPEPGYLATKRLLQMKQGFTALVAFNDVSAIGAIRALRDAGLQVPRDVSVIGFDDIQAAEFQNPGLTTVRQPLRKMGEAAAETLILRINDPKCSPKRTVVEPELVIRESTAPVLTAAAQGSK
jgi:LacI family transcriptional regulator